MALGSRVRFYRDKLAWTLATLSERSGVDVGTISALEARDSRRSQYMAPLAKAFGLTVEQLLDEHHDHLARAAAPPAPWLGDNPPPTQGAAPRPRGAQARPVSQPENSSSPLIDWGSLMHHTPLPKVFRVVVPDDAMAPKAVAGQVAQFSTGLAPRPNDGVLVVDRDGAHYFREYHARRHGRWEARPINPAYEPLESERDGLRLVAVFTGWPELRWG